MPSLDKRALAIAFIPTLFASFLMQALIGSHAAADSTPAAAHRRGDGAAEVALTSTDCRTGQQDQRGTENLVAPAPALLAP